MFGLNTSALSILGFAGVVLILSACDIHLGSEGKDASVNDGSMTDGPNVCPADPFAALGTACSPEGRSCDNGHCGQACSICNVIQCQNGKWAGVEVFPDPRCSDGGTCSHLNQSCSASQPCCAEQLACSANVCASYKPDMAGMCPQTCSACSPGQTCLVGTGYTQAGCLPSCQSDDDCITFVASRCMSVITNPQDFPQKPPFSYSPRVCISWPNAGPTAPMFCPGVATTNHCDILSPPTCEDAQTLLRYAAAPGTCGKEYVHCAQGCQQTAPDGGAPQGACL